MSPTYALTPEQYAAYQMELAQRYYICLQQSPDRRTDTMKTLHRNFRSWHVPLRMLSKNEYATFSAQAYTIAQIWAREPDIYRMLQTLNQPSPTTTNPVQPTSTDWDDLCLVPYPTLDTVSNVIGNTTNPPLPLAPPFVPTPNGDPTLYATFGLHIGISFLQLQQDLETVFFPGNRITADLRLQNHDVYLASPEVSGAILDKALVCADDPELAQYTADAYLHILYVPTSTGTNSPLLEIYLTSRAYGYWRQHYYRARHR